MSTSAFFSISFNHLKVQKLFVPVPWNIGAEVSPQSVTCRSNYLPLVCLTGARTISRPKESGRSPSLKGRVAATPRLLLVIAREAKRRAIRRPVP